MYLITGFILAIITTIITAIFLKKQKALLASIPMNDKEVKGLSFGIIAATAVLIFIAWPFFIWVWAVCFLIFFIWLKFFHDKPGI